MNTGLWVWPSDPRAQRKTLLKVAGSQHLVKAMGAIAKSKEGLSNAELDDIIADNSNWMTLWVIRQLTALGFIEFNVDLFGGPAKYRLTELGRSSLAIITSQPPAPKQPAPVARAPVPVAAPAAKPS